MAVKEKACLNCKNIYTDDACPRCSNTQNTESFKGKVTVFDHTKSEIAYKLDIHGEGEFAIKTK